MSQPFQNQVFYKLFSNKHVPGKT